MVFCWFCIIVIAVCWVEHGLAIRKNVVPPEGVTYSGSRLGQEADCKGKANITCDNIWWSEKSQSFGNLFVSQGPQASLTFNFSGDQIYVYGIPSSGNGASAIFILDNTPPQSVNTSNVSKGGSDPIILWSNQTLEAGNHTLRVEYDPSSRKDDTIRYLVLHNFSYNDLSKTFSLPAPPNSASSPALPSPTVQPSENENFIAGYTWNKYVAPAPILGAVLSTAVLLLLFGTTILLCKYRRKRRQDALAPDPFIDRDSFPDSMPSHIHLSTIQESTDTSQHYLRLRPYVEPIQAQRDFPPPPRPPPTVTSFSHGDQIAETLSTMSLDGRQSSIYEPRGSRLHIPGSSYRRHA